MTTIQMPSECKDNSAYKCMRVIIGSIDAFDSITYGLTMIFINVLPYIEQNICCSGYDDGF